MTIDDVQAALEIIRKFATEGDYESAHSAEDKLFTAVLRAVANGTGGALIAGQALESLKIEFERHCA